MSATPHQATEGAFALRIDVRDDGREKAVVRKEVDLDLSRTTTLGIDAFNLSSQAPGLALAMHSTDGAWFELRSQALHPGWNRDLRWSLEAKDDFSTGTDLTAWQAKSGTIDRLMVLVRPVKGDCSLVVDNLRALGPVVLRRDRVRALNVIPPASPVPRHHGAEVGVNVVFPPITSLSATAADPWLTRMTAVQARVAQADGSSILVNGFCSGLTAEPDGVHYAFTVRLPTEISGVERFQIGVAAGGSYTWSTPGALVVGTQDDGPGMVRRDAGHPRWLERDGSWFYPLGENVAWSADYEPYASAIAAAGGNCMRVWICPWNNPLDTAGHLAAINFQNASAIDAMFAACARHGLVVQLCLDYHAALTWDWPRNPWNVVNGGPCASASEFWSNDLARDHFRKLLDYCVARWGTSPQLMAWELFNEADLAPRPSDDVVVAWHHEMASYLHAIDPSRHLVTSSVSTAEALPALWTDAGLDLIEVHAYGVSPPAQLGAIAERFAHSMLPLLVGEWGRGTGAADDQLDHGGVALRQALWCGFMAGMSGAPLPWWWDTHMEPDHLLGAIGHLRSFARDVHLPGQDLHPLQTELAPGVDAHCLIGASSAYGYVFAPEATAQPGATELGRPLGGRQLELSGLPAGAWRLELWDPAQGRLIGSSQLTVQDQSATFPAPALAEFAFKLLRLKPLEAGMRLR